MSLPNFGGNYFLLSPILACLLIWLSYCDISKLQLPGAGILTLVVISIPHNLETGIHEFVLRSAFALLVAAALWLIGELYFRHYQTEGLGIGDAKLFGAGTFLLGPAHIPDLFLLSSLGGIIAYGVGYMLRKDVEKGIPFGPFIAYAIFILHFIDPIFI